MKKFSILLIVVLLFGFTTMQAQAIDITWVHSNAAAQSEQRAQAGFDAYLEEQGWDWDVSILDSGGSGEETASNVEDAVERGVDAIIVSMADLRAARAPLRNAVEDGIPVFGVDSGYVEELVVDVTSNNYVIGARKSTYMINELGGEGNIVAFKMAEHHGVRKRGNTLDVVLEENPGIEVLAEHNIDYTEFYEDTMETMHDYIMRFGLEEIDAVWAGWDEPGQAAAEAIMAQGGTRDDVFVVGSDGHPTAGEYIRDETPFKATVAQSFEPIGEQVARYIHEIVVEGRSEEEVIPTNTVYMDTPLVTPANLPPEGEYLWDVD